MAREQERSDNATEEDQGLVGRMTPIDPGAGPGGTIAQEGHADIASPAPGTTGGAVASDAADGPPNRARDDLRDPGKAYGSDKGEQETP